MGQNSLNGRWHSEDGPSPVPLLRPCLCLTEPLSLGTCHSPHPQGRPLGIASHTYLGWLSAALCPVPFVTPFLYLCLLPRDPRGVRVDCCPLPPYPRSSCYAPEQEVWPNCPGSTSEWGGHAGPLAAGLETSSGTLRGPWASFWVGVSVSAFIQQPLPTTLLGASFWKPAARATASHCCPEFLLGAGRPGSPSPLGPWDG